MFSVISVSSLWFDAKEILSASAGYLQNIARTDQPLCFDASDKETTIADKPSTHSHPDPNRASRRWKTRSKGCNKVRICSKDANRSHPHTH
jgi:hypothetical protein